MLPSFTDIYYFLEVARSRSISRAAEKLGITQPSLSAAMQRLEDRLGTQLFVRERSGVQLTRAGRDLVTGGEALVTRWQQLKTSISKRQHEPGGQYVLGCHPSVALYTLANFLPHLLQTYPELEVKLVHNLSRKITEGVVSFSIDFGIVVNPVQHPDLVIRELCHDVVTFWCARQPSSVQALDTDNRVLICDPELAQIQSLLQKLRKKQGARKRQGVSDVAQHRHAFCHRIVQSSSLEVIADLTAAGAGIGILPARVAKLRKLRLLDKTLPTYKDRICLVYRVDYQRHQGSKTIINAIRNSRF